MGRETCPSCGQEVAPGQRFCARCGVALARPCRSCGTANPAHFHFCPHCGERLEAAGEPAAHRPAGERRWVTVLFADLSGFTHLSQEMDPEDIRTFVDGCMVGMGHVVEQFGGSVSRVIGDALLALFGAPVAHEDDPERAVRAALELQRYARDNRDELRGLSLRIGVNTGEMMYAPVGPDRTFTVMGDAANTAARLQAAAAPGIVVVGEETYRVTREAIRYEHPEQLEVKGKDAPIWVARAIEPMVGPGARGLSAAPLVGRSAEMAMLRTTWDRVVEQRVPQLVTLLGGPGVGKSRLSREFAASLVDLGGRTVQGRSLPYGESTGYGAFGQQVDMLAGIFESDPVPVAQEKLRRRLASLLPTDVAEDVTLQLTVMLGLTAQGTVPDRGVMFFAARRLVEALARERPLLLLFEDMHWADPSLLDLLEYLAGRVEDAPVLFLVLARPELVDRRPAWASILTSSARVGIEPLSSEDGRDLARSLLPGISEPSIIDRLVETAGGNPLFVEELAASLMEQATPLVTTLPTNVKAIIAARLDALPTSERQVLLDAAVVGRFFWKGTLSSLGWNGTTAGLLDSLEERDFIRRETTSRFEDDDEFSFKHILIREVAYGTLPRAERRRKHAAVARFVEERAGDRLAESASLLAHHWREAGDVARAVEYLLVAAEHAARAWAKGEAIELYTEALELVPPNEHARRTSILLQRAIAMAQSGDFKGAAAELDALLPGLSGRDRLEALIERARVAYWLVDLDGGITASAEAGALADALGEDHLRARAWAVAGVTAAQDGRPADACALGEAALQAWSPGSHDGDRGVLLGYLGAFHYWVGDYPPAVERARLGYELSIENHNVEGILVGGADLGLALTGMGRHEEAFSIFEEVAARGRSIEIVPRFTARAMNMWAGALREVFQLDQARALNEEAVELARRSAFSFGYLQGRIDLLIADLMDGEVASAEAAWIALWDEARAVKGLHRWLMAGRLATARADIALAAGHAEDAADAAEEAIVYADRHGRRKYRSASELVLGRALLELGRPGEASVALQTALEEARRLAHPPLVARAARSLADALWAVGNAEGAEAAWRTAAAEITGFAQTLAEERSARFLQAPQVAELLTSPAR